MIIIVCLLVGISTQFLRLPPFSTAYSYPIELASYLFNTFHLLPIL
jgi:hypothetical protein